MAAKISKIVLIAQFFLSIYKLCFTIKRSKFEHRQNFLTRAKRRNREIFNQKNYAKTSIGIFGLVVQVKSAHFCDGVEIARSGRRPRGDGDNCSNITTLSELEHDSEHTNFNRVSKCKYYKPAFSQDPLFSRGSSLGRHHRILFSQIWIFLVLSNMTNHELSNLTRPNIGMQFFISIILANTRSGIAGVFDWIYGYA